MTGRRSCVGGGARGAPAATIIIIDDDDDDDDGEEEGKDLEHSSSAAGHQSCWNHSLATLNDRLNNKVFESYLENLWRSFSDERRNSFIYISSLWFANYLIPHFRSKVLTWIKGKKIFSKKYILVPIVRWNHWSLLILCHLDGQSSSSETGYQGPCMLLLDSLQMADPRRLEPDIRKFLLDIFTVEGRQANKQLISEIPLLVPKVPQQRNGVECGIYVLFFIDLFVQHAPNTFSLDGYPYFMQENWFSEKGVDAFRTKLISLANQDEGNHAQAPIH